MHRVSCRENLGVFYFYFLLEREGTQEDALNNILDMHLYLCVSIHIHLYSHPTHWYWYIHNFIGVRGGEDRSWHSLQLPRQPPEHAEYANTLRCCCELLW